jgi:hypothetical protein
LGAFGRYQKAAHCPDHEKAKGSHGIASFLQRILEHARRTHSDKTKETRFALLHCLPVKWISKSKCFEPEKGAGCFAVFHVLGDGAYLDKVAGYPQMDIHKPIRIIAHIGE